MNSQRSAQEITHKKKSHTDLSPIDDPMGGMFGGNTLLYFFVGVATVSLGVSLFLYKEVKKVKTDISDISTEIKGFKEQSEAIEENTKLVQGLDDKVNKLGIMLQHTLANKMAPGPSSVSVPPIPKVESETEVPVEVDNVKSGGPFDECEDGVCKVPKKEGKILEI